MTNRLGCSYQIHLPPDYDNDCRWLSSRAWNEADWSRAATKPQIAEAFAMFFKFQNLPWASSSSVPPSPLLFSSILITLCVWMIWFSYWALFVKIMQQKQFCTSATSLSSRITTSSPSSPSTLDGSGATASASCRTILRGACHTTSMICFSIPTVPLGKLQKFLGRLDQT